MAKTGTGKYAPVVEALREQITSGALEPGDWLPSESALMDQYGVTRYSVREAIKRLVSDGLIAVVDGKGSHVRRRREHAANSDLRMVWTHERPDGGVVFVDAETRQWQEIESPGTYRTNTTLDLAVALGVPEHTPLFVYDRLLATANAGPEGRRMTHRVYVPMPTCARVSALADNPFRAADDLYATLSEAGMDLRWTEHVRATAPTPDDITALRVPPGAAVLVTRRITTEPDGRPLAMEETRRSADDTQLTYTVTPVPAQ